MSQAEPVLRSDQPVTLAGGGTVTAQDLEACLSLAPRLVAADGGANRLLALGRQPEHIIGDMDSLSLAARQAVPPEALHRVAEQDSTDFEKCLTRIDAPLILAVGVSGPRHDHALAAFNVLLRYPERRCIMLGDEDAITLAPAHLVLDLPPGCRVSLFPMGAVRGQSQGLKWPIDDICFSPSGRSGTSNAATGPVDLRLSGPGMLLILPRAYLPQLQSGMVAAPPWRHMQDICL